MVGRVGRGAALAAAAAAGVAALMPAQADAAPTATSVTPHVVGTELTWAHGIPRAVKRGQTLTFSVWYTQNSPDTMDILSYQLGVWNMANPGFGQLKGLTLSFLNPVTGKWERPSVANPNGTIVFDLHGKEIGLAPKRAGHVYMRVTFGASAHLGTWHLDASPGDYSLITLRGAYDPDFLRTPDKQYTFTLTR